VQDAYRMEVTERALETAVCQLLSFQVISVQAAGGIPNMEASMNKMYGSELQQRVATTQMHVTGMDGQLQRADPLALECGLRPGLSYLGTVSATIAAGTSEIQRNIIATRGLGLPRG
jgi:alkylation response protein AidB-like acyl-CoA dehydrogenase